MESFKDSSEDQELSKLLQRFFESEAGPTYRRQRFEGELVNDPIFWSKLKQLGLFESFAIKDSALGCKALARVAFQSGKAIIPESLVEHLLSGPVLFGQLLNSTEQGKKQTTLIGEDILDQIAAAELIATCSISPKIVNSTNELEKELKFVPAIERSQLLVHAQGDKLSLIDLRPEIIGSALKSEKLNSLDRNSSLYNLSTKNLKAVLLSNSLGSHFSDILFSLKACELAGIAEKVTEMTLEYIKTRKQFGVNIGSFQAVQHKISDMKLASEAIRALAYFAAWCADSSKLQLPLAAKSALLFAIEKTPTLIETAIQLHGGIGFSWEFDLHLFLRRAKSIEALFSEQKLSDGLLLAASSA